MAACSYLHRCRVVHRDIKPVNVLVDPASLTLRLADFGLSRVIETTDSDQQTNKRLLAADMQHCILPLPPPQPVASSHHVPDLIARVASMDLVESQVAERSSDSSDIESDSPPLLMRKATKEVVTRWYQPNCPAHSRAEPDACQVESAGGVCLPRPLQRGHRHMEHRLHLRRAPAHGAGKRCGATKKNWKALTSAQPLSDLSARVLFPGNYCRRSPPHNLHRNPKPLITLSPLLQRGRSLCAAHTRPRDAQLLLQRPGRSLR